MNLFPFQQTLLNSGIDCFGYGDNEPPEEVTVSDPKHSRKFTSTVSD